MLGVGEVCVWVCVTTVPLRADANAGALMHSQLLMGVFEAVRSGSKGVALRERRHQPTHGLTC
jgi:hypothetical protein